MAKRVTYYVYGLIDPRTAMIRYIGMTCLSTGVSLSHHLSQVKADRSAKAKRIWLNALLSQDLRPQPVILQAVQGKAAGIVCRRNWINEARSRGWEVTNGQQGDEPLASMEPQTRRKRAAYREIQLQREVSGQAALQKIHDAVQEFSSTIVANVEMLAPEKIIGEAVVQQEE